MGAMSAIKSLSQVDSGNTLIFFLNQTLASLCCVPSLKLHLFGMNLIRQAAAECCPLPLSLESYAKLFRDDVSPSGASVAKF